MERITLKALLRCEALARLTVSEHRFCGTPECPVVYFGHEVVFDREEILVPVLQKQPEGERTVCYCFGITDADLRREIAETGLSTAARRIGALVRADRCACEVRNPQGKCCLGNIAAVLNELTTDRSRPRAR